ncbi:MAG: hypothetical protein OEY66_04610 [Gammaproteobacteria bacterium]|nr:hypothetical protein [Gammaproteobacteria bacterium]
MLFKTDSKTIFFTCLFWLSFFCTPNTFAKDSFPLITYECNTEKDFILVTNTLLKDGKEKTFKYSDADGTYSPWDMVKIENNKIIDTSLIKKTCKLSSAEYTVVLEPQIFNQNLDGKCGATISAAITIVSNSAAIMDRKPFDFYCTGNVQVITGVKVIGKTGEIKTRTEPRYKFY